jgi:hypothetical protein
MQVLQLHSLNQLGSLAILYQFRCTGIYESDEKVIQYCGTGLFSSSSHSGSSSSWFGFSVPHRTCPKCREAERRGGAVISCLNCFLEGDSLRLFPYSVPPWFRFKSMLASSQATCLMAPEDPPEMVLRRANNLLDNGSALGFASDDYNLLTNNCVDFAIYCKTGRRDLKWSE